MRSPPWSWPGFLFLQSEDGERDVSLYICSPGGSITAGLAMHDTMRDLTCDVATIAMGLLGSMATVLLAAGTKSKRICYPMPRCTSIQRVARVSGATHRTSTFTCDGCSTSRSAGNVSWPDTPDRHTSASGTTFNAIDSSPHPRQWSMGGSASIVNEPSR